MQSENAINLENAIVATLTRQRVPTEEEVQILAESLRQIPNFAVDDNEFSLVLRRIHSRLQIDMDTGTAIFEECQPWLPARKPDIEPSL